MTQITPADVTARPADHSDLLDEGLQELGRWVRHKFVTAGAASGSLGVLADHGHARLVADNPRIVTRRASENVAGADFDLTPIGHPNSHLARDDVGKMRNLARISPGNRLHVVRPAPAGFERAATNRLAADLRRNSATSRVGLSGLPRKKDGTPITGGQVLFEYVQDPLPPPIGAGRQVFRSVSVANGSLRDWFGPHDVDVYRFGL